MSCTTHLFGRVVGARATHALDLLSSEENLKKKKKKKTGMRAVVRQSWGDADAGPKTLSLIRGLPVDVLEVNADWSYVSFGGQRGFVPTANLESTEGQPLEASPSRGGGGGGGGRGAVMSKTSPEKMGLPRNLMATVVLEYEAELAEGLFVSG